MQSIPSGNSTPDTLEIQTPDPNFCALPPKAKKGKRVEVAVVISLVTLSAIFMGSWVWALFVICFLVMGFQEMRTIMGALNTKPSSFIVLCMGGLMVLCAAMNHPEFLPPILTITVIASFFRLLFKSPVGSMNDIAGSLLAVVYLAYFPVHFIMLRELTLPPPPHMWDWGTTVSPLLPFFQKQPGLSYLLLIIIVISICDIAAYYAGKKFGRSLLYPEVSPKKTREGSVVGILAGFTAGVAFSWLSGFPLQHGMFLSFLMTIVGQIGDLIESVFKRNAGIKDSSGLLYGHGGLLDRMDSYIFAGVIAYYYIYWVVLDQGLARDVRHLWHGLF